MTEQAWHRARLIPTSGITGANKQDRRATCATLAVMSAVKEFGGALTQGFGAPAGTLVTHIKVPFVLGDKKGHPDGLIRVTRAGRAWTGAMEGTGATGDPQETRHHIVITEASLDVGPRPKALIATARSRGRDVSTASASDASNPEGTQS